MPNRPDLPWSPTMCASSLAWGDWKRKTGLCKVLPSFSNTLLMRAGQAPPQLKRTRRRYWIETLSKVAVAKEDVLRLLTARPTYTLGAMVTVWLVPNGVQFTPFVEPYMVNTLPLRTSFSQLGGVALPSH